MTVYYKKREIVEDFVDYVTCDRCGAKINTDEKPTLSGDYSSATLYYKDSEGPDEKSDLCKDCYLDIIHHFISNPEKY
jgi:hypothetical protein